MFYIWRIHLYCGENWNIPKFGFKYPESLKCGDGIRWIKYLGAIAWEMK